MIVEPIGYVRNDVTEVTDAGWGGVVSEIHLDERLAEGLRGLDEFSHALIIFAMHRADFDPERDLVRRPRERDDMPEMGIFAQRARHRPAPIAITPVRILGAEGNVLRVQGLDAIDWSPVLDIKPYVPSIDQVADATEPEWMTQLMEGYF